MEIFYLFNVRYLHRTSFSLVGAMGTPAVLLAIAAVVIAQFAFTYLPAMNALFDSAPVAFADGLLIVAIGVVTMAILETEKALTRRLWPAAL
jgi:magnesium-transporting ATPase (P-type)